MPTPSPTAYSAATGKPVHAGREGYPHALLDRIAAAPDASWLKINTNTYESCFVSDAFSLSSPEKILSAWSSVAYDSKRHRIYLWGGGHANTSNTEVYQFDMQTGVWSLGYRGSEMYLVTVAGETNTTQYETRGGCFSAPVSAHTYDCNNYLPVLDRCVFFGGAAFNTGAIPLVRIPEGSDPALRVMGAYTFSIPLIGQGFVSGYPGTNRYGGSGDRVDLPGARAWELRDWYRPDINHEGPGGSGNGSVGAITVENGYDVAYCNFGRSLWRVEFHENWEDDVITKWGSYAQGASGLKTSAFDLSRNLFVTNSANHPDKTFTFWDTDTPGASNYDLKVAPADLGGPNAADYLNEYHYQSAMKWNPDTGKLMIWCEGTVLANQPTRTNLPGRVYALTPPTGMKPTPMTGWTIELECDGAGESPVTWEATEADRAGGTSGMAGKWRWAEDLRGFIGIQSKWRGDVFFYKPAGWVDPRI